MKRPALNPLTPFLEDGRTLVLDGGLATAMEARGCDLNHELWSAKVLMEDPDLIRSIHVEYLAAGADCIASASYQASLEGFRRSGLSDHQGRDLLVVSVRLALEARDGFWADHRNREGRIKPIVAASIGPYGAFLADGSEYTGNYKVSDQEVYDFHRDRWHLLAGAGPDLMACETIPGLGEAEILIQLLRETPEQWAWISFSCRDARHVSDGGLVRDAARALDREPRVAAMGINCIAPEIASPLIEEIRQETDKPILVYPNSGESYDAADKRWHSAPSAIQLETEARDWIQRGASGVGGCCRVGPRQIARIRDSLEAMEE